MKKAQEIKPICALRLRECRNMKRLTLARLEELSGISQQTINKIEREKSPLTDKVAYILADHLGVSKEYLCGETDFKNNKEKAYNSVDLFINSKRAFDDFLFANDILKTPCGIFDSGNVLGEEERYEEGIGLFTVPITYYEELYKISMKECSEEYILTESQLSELQKEIEEYTKFRIMRMCKFFKKENEAYKDDID